MTVSLKSVARDVKAEREGEWRESQLFPGVSYKVKSFNDPHFRRARDSFQERKQRKFGNKPADPEWGDSEFGKVIAQHLLVDWSGFDQEFSAELAHEILADPQYRDVADDVVAAARNVGDPDLVQAEEDQGNSRRSSSGKSSTGQT